MEPSSSLPEIATHEIEQDEDELLSDYDEEEPSGTFKIPQALLPPKEMTLTTEELYSQMYDQLIELSPAYQRDVVWPSTKQSLLIDSIFRNLYIPPLVFAASMNEFNEKILICIDGKQRLTSIQRFMDGSIAYKNSRTKKSYWYTAPDDSSREELPEEGKRLFNEKVIRCIEYDNLPMGADRELFQRVQLGISLTAAEKLQAIASPWAEWIAVLESQHVKVEGGLTVYLQVDIRRGRNFQNFANMLFCCAGLPEQHLPSTSKLEKWLSRMDPPPPRFKDDINGVLTSLWRIASSKELNQGFKKIIQRLAPVEFVFIGVLLYQLRHQPLSDQATAIYILRTTIRHQHKDIRNNSTVARALWNIVSALADDPTAPIIPGMGQQIPRAKKMRSYLDDSDESDEFEGGPVRNKKASSGSRARGPISRK